LSGKVKQNHIFACLDDDKMILRESNLEQHVTSNFKLSRKGRAMNATNLQAYTLRELIGVECAGLNPYKMVELWKNYRPHVDPNCWKNILYRKPDDKVLALVKSERSEQSVFWEKLKVAKASGMKQQLDSIALGNNEGRDKNHDDNNGDDCDDMTGKGK
jgi:hypothetical protein